MAHAWHRKIPGLRRPFLKLDAARAKRDAAIAERDAAIAARDAALKQWSGSPRHGNLQRIESLRAKPWYTVDLPPEVVQAESMISLDERRLLYTLARDYFSGHGRIIDGGAYLGASSLALGYGLKHRSYPEIPVIDAFDIFLIDEHSRAHHFGQYTPEQYDWLTQEIKAGDNIRFVYEHNIAPVASYIDIHEGDLTLATWSGEPIEILFSDISKGWKLNDYITLNWIPHLLPETGILIQQDQVQEYHVWVAITMEILADYFELIDYVVYDSVVYRLKHAIPQQVLDKCLSPNISHDEMEYYYLSWLERFRRIGMGRYRGWTLGMVEAGLVVVYGFHIGDIDKAWHALQQCEAKFYDIPDTMARLATIRSHLQGHTFCPGGAL